jgi:hypothetical protein
MNTIGLLLVLGLALFALKQKSEKTRNMLLIASTLLGFCMFSAEGFAVAVNQDMTALFSGTITGGTAGAAGTRDGVNPVTVTGGSNRYIFTGNNALELVGGTGVIPSGITCKTGLSGETLGTVGYNSTFTATAATTPPQQPLSSIDTYLTCDTPTTACPAKATDAAAVITQNASCGTDKTYKTTISATDKYTGASTGEDFKAKCCTPSGTPPATPMPNCGPNAECDGSVPTLGGVGVATNKSNQCGSTMFGQWDMTCRCIKDTDTWTSGASNGCTAVPA